MRSAICTGPDASRPYTRGVTDAFICADVRTPFGRCGGVESMTRAPIVTLKPDTAYPRGAPESADSTLGWRFSHPRLVADGHTVTLGQTAENVAQRRGVSRADQDCLALLSQQKAERAMANGVLAEEVGATPVPTPG